MSLELLSMSIKPEGGRTPLVEDERETGEKGNWPEPLAG